MVSVTFYDSSIDVLDNLWEKHLKRNQIMEKQQFSPKIYSSNNINTATNYTATPGFWDCDGFYQFIC